MIKKYCEAKDLNLLWSVWSCFKNRWEELNHQHAEKQHTLMTQGHLYSETPIPSTAQGHSFHFQAVIAHKIWIKSPWWCSEELVWFVTWFVCALFMRTCVRLCVATVSLSECSPTFTPLFSHDWTEGAIGVIVVNGVALSKHWDTSKWAGHCVLTTVKASVNVRKHGKAKRAEGRTSIEIWVFMCVPV